MLYLTLGLVHYHQKKHHLCELDHIPVEKKNHQMINYFKGECVHHMLNTDENMIVAGH